MIDGEPERSITEDECLRAKNRALRFLAARAHSVQEIEQKLRRYYDELTVKAVADDLCELGLLCDAAYAEERARQLAARGKSPADIQNRLRAAGVSGEVAARAVAALDIDAVAVACAVIDKHYLAALQNGEEQKVKAALARRGFKHGDIAEAVCRAREDTP